MLQIAVGLLLLMLWGGICLAVVSSRIPLLIKVGVAVAVFPLLLLGGGVLANCEGSVQLLCLPKGLRGISSLGIVAGTFGFFLSVPVGIVLSLIGAALSPGYFENETVDGSVRAARVMQHLEPQHSGDLSPRMRRMYGRLSRTMVAIGCLLLVLCLIVKSGTLAVGAGLGAAAALALAGTFQVAVRRNIHIWREANE